MSHPLLVEAIETEFVPVAIHNNKAGKDAEILKRYEEPAWNNPVMRFVDAAGKDVLPRKDRVWQTNAVALRMIAALKAAKRPVPGYLELAEIETRTAGIQTTTFAMSCFWEGESRLGGLEGVTGTRAGWMDGREVVELRFDPKLISYTELLGQARKMNCLSEAFVRTEEHREIAAATLGASKAKLVQADASDAKASDQLYYLRKSPLAKLALSPLQKTRINAALRVGGDAKKWLSPRQRASLR